MSVTTTANPQTYTLSSVLADYELHHSEAAELDTSLNAHPSPSSSNSSSSPAAPPSNNPTHWPSDHRRVPPYRPVNTELDQSQRRVYQNGIERTFVTVMFTGVLIEATASKVWRGTFGRIWNVGYGVGGEW